MGGGGLFNFKLREMALSPYIFILKHKFKNKISVSAISHTQLKELGFRKLMLFRDHHIHLRLNRGNIIELKLGKLPDSFSQGQERALPTESHNHLFC